MTIWFEEAIPIEKAQMIEVLRNHLPLADREESAHLALLLETCCTEQFQKIWNRLYSYYQPFNPNTAAPTALSEKEEWKYVQNLIQNFCRFLEQGQYQPIAEADIRDILKQTKIAGIKLVLPPERYREFLLYYRGREIVTKPFRTWRTLWLKNHIKVITHYRGLNLFFRPFHKSLAVAFEDQNVDYSPLRSQSITLKLFQSIQQDLLPIILPGILIKTSLKTKLYIVGQFILANTVASLALWGNPAWYALLGLVPFAWFVLEMVRAEVHTRQYHRTLLTQLYHKNISNNSGVLRHLVDRSAEETYKQQMLVLYALWKRPSWAFGSVGLKDLQRHLQRFLLQSLGLDVTLNLENIVSRLLDNYNPLEYPGSVKLLLSNSQSRAYLKREVTKNSTYIDLPDSEQPLPRCGIFEIAPGQEKRECIAFMREEYLLTLANSNGLEFSHSKGAVVRWILPTPIKITLVKDCTTDNDVLLVSEKEAEALPLQGMGRIFVAEENKHIEFRYNRKRGESKLLLNGGLRYPHIPMLDHPVLVRPVLPRIILTVEISPESRMMSVPQSNMFPREGLLKLESGDQAEIVAYQQESSKGLHIIKCPVGTYPPGTFATLTPATTTFSHNTPRGALILNVQNTQFFHKRGYLIVAPHTEWEERVPFRGEIWELELYTPLQNNHKRGCLVSIKEPNVKTSLIYEAKRKSRRIYIQGTIHDVSSGILQVDLGENCQESVGFSIVSKSFDLSQPTRFFHPIHTEVLEANLESPLRYQALQGSHLITVENADSFPLAGTLEIHYNGNRGIKEVFPFMRIERSNTLILKTQIKQIIHQNTVISITAVETTLEQPHYYHQNTILANFACVPDFPQEGEAILEPGSQIEEKISFQRFPQRIYLQKPCKHDHQIGTMVDFSNYANYITHDDWAIYQERISLEYQHLLPQHGSLILKEQNDVEEIVWYRKKNNRVLLEEPCRFHHSQETAIILPTIKKHVRLIDWVEKGSREIQISNPQELPKHGKIVITGFLHTEIVEFSREGDILFLCSPLEHSFGRLATRISLPEIYLNIHASPGMDYLEISDASYLPESGELILDPDCKYQERIAFQYRPEILWLYQPLSKNYKRGTRIHSPELFAKGAGNLDALPINKTSDTLQEKVFSIYSKSISFPKNVDPAISIPQLCSITQMYLKQINDIGTEGE